VGVHIHDLRHTGNQFTANAGTNIKELMVRMGHDSDRAALIYLHSSDKRQRALADAVAKAARAELAQTKKATKPGCQAGPIWHCQVRVPGRHLSSGS
jgi:hypothetical protein